jgi:cell division septation protein DedD
MPRNDDGEFELILGNKQLLSVFFIVVILLGVFFTTGYIVGRSSTPSVDARRADRPVNVEPANRPTPNGAAASSQTPPASIPPVTVAPPPETPAVKETPAPEKPVETVEVKRETHKAEKSEGTRSRSRREPPSGMYLQIAATAKSEAELFVDVLTKKGFDSTYAPVPEKEGIFRVLVGPLKDAASISQTRGDLQKGGFKGFEAIVKRY